MEGISMVRPYPRKNPASTRRTQFALAAAIAIAGGSANAKPYVEFDFSPIAECRDVTAPLGDEYTGERLVAVSLPVSVRFHGVAPEDVDELDIEISGAAAGLRIHDFAPATQLTSDVQQAIEQTTTTKNDRALDATLGGQLPLPYAEMAANVAPSINAGISRSEIATEKVNRLPPKHAVVVSGTLSEGRGVFFKLKRSSQTSLEGVHELTVVFVVPKGWQGDAARINCSARGRRELFWIKQSATLGRVEGTVQLHVQGSNTTRAWAEKRAAHVTANRDRSSLFEAAAKELVYFVDMQPSNANNPSRDPKTTSPHTGL
jgi:hypothetical protein